MRYFRFPLYKSWSYWFFYRNELKTKPVIFCGPKDLKRTEDLIWRFCLNNNFQFIGTHRTFQYFLVLLLMKCNERKVPYICYGCTISFDGSCCIFIRKLKLRINSVVLSGANQVLFCNYSVNIVFQCFFVEIQQCRPQKPSSFNKKIRWGPGCV